MTTIVSVFRDEELDCATEENELREVLTPLTGVRGLEFDLVARHVRVRHELETPDTIAAAIRSVGMRPKLLIAEPTATNSRVCFTGMMGQRGREIVFDGSLPGR